MADSDMHNDEAVRYVMDRLGTDERRKFEQQLANSAELQALVRELEAGAIALALAAPQHEIPANTWQGIEDAVAQEKPVVSPSFWPLWLRNGWAAAAVCLLGWVLSMFWLTRPHQPPTSQALAEQPQVQAERESADPAHPRVRSTIRQASIVTNSYSPQLSLLAKGQISTLRREVLALEATVEQLSQTVTQQQALLSDPTRLKFFNLPPAGAEGATNVPPPSPAAQRALLLAVARRLGWLQSAGESDDEDSGVDFVELQSPAGAQTTAVQSASNTNQQAQTQPANRQHDTNAALPSIASAIPGYAAPSANGKVDLTFALDPAMLPSGVSTLDVWASHDASSVSALYYGPWDIGNSGSAITLRDVSWVGFSEPSIPTGPTNHSPISWILTNAP